eukprot:3936308-Rhodomonas_salina.2
MPSLSNVLTTYRRTLAQCRTPRGRSVPMQYSQTAGMRGTRVLGGEKYLLDLLHAPAAPYASSAPVSYTHLRAHETEADL